MEQLSKKKHKIILLFCLLFIFVFFFQLLIPLFSLKVFASVETYSNVIDDLKKAENFNLSLYPEKEKDYSLDVITLAEGVNDELFVYVYQPSHNYIDLEATLIRMSIPKVGIDTSWRDYKLSLVSSEGVFDKYIVEGVQVDKSATVRYYDVVAIYRDYNSELDGKLSNDNTASSVPYTIARQWSMSNVNEDLICKVLDTEVVEITDKLVGYVQYPEGFKLFPSWCDSHIVAFSTDHRIDKLMEVEIYYVTQKYGQSIGIGLPGTKNPQGDPVPDYITRTYLDEGGNQGSGWFAEKYTWDRIETVDTFLNSVSSEDIKITEEATKSLSDLEFVVRFLETERSMIAGTGVTTEFWTKVYDVSIVRLKFETDGIVYNLGVVDNHQTGSDDPIGGPDPDNDSLLTKIIGLILLIIIIVIILRFKGPLNDLIHSCFDAIGLVLNVILYPFKLIFRRKK